MHSVANKNKIVMKYNAILYFMFMGIVTSRNNLWDLRLSSVTVYMYVYDFVHIINWCPYS